MNENQKRILKNYLIAIAVIVVISVSLLGAVMLGYAEGGTFIWD